MKSFRSIVTEEDAEMAADIPAMAGDTELETGDELDSVQGNGEAPLAAEEAEGVEAAADQVADDIVSGDEDGEPEDAPVASVDAPHEEPDGDEGPNPTAPSDNDGDEETPTVPETAAVQASESLVIVQCGLIATQSAMKINEAASTEAFLGATDVSSKQAVVEGFKEKVSAVWGKLKAFVIRIKDAIVNFVKKVVLYVKKLFAKVYVKLNKALFFKKASENWSAAASEITLKAPSGFNQGIKVISQAASIKVDDVTPKGSTVAEVDKARENKHKDMADKIAKYDDYKSKNGTSNVKLTSIFANFSAVENYIAKEGTAKVMFSTADANQKAVVDACKDALTTIDKKEDAALVAAKVKYINSRSNDAVALCRTQTAMVIKGLQLAATAIRKVAKFKTVKASYIDQDLLAFFDAK